jgi:2-methylisocitrate lyase-like PEP mutase family enzyme
MNKIKMFSELHKQNTPFILPNVWNSRSAKICEESGFRAIATSSAAVADSMGYEDGEKISFEKYFYIIERINSVISIPFSVDIEGGFGRSSSQVIENILRLADIGIAGINIEDSVVSDGSRHISPPEEFNIKLKNIIEILKSRYVDIFINIRTDTFLLNTENKKKDTINRIKIYEDSGIDGIFIPGLIEPDDIIDIRNSTKLPLNIMYMPGLPDFEELTKSGVNRISMGDFLFKNSYSLLKMKIEKITKQNNLNLLIEDNIN